MPPTTLILAATRPELAPAVATLGLRWHGRTQAEGDHHHGRIIAHLTGVGPARAVATLDQQWARTPPDTVISLGFAGGLAPHLPAGHVAIIHTVTHTTHDRLDLTPQPPIPNPQSPPAATLLTLNRMAATVADKRDLHQRFAADLVDMETHPLAVRVRGLAREAGRPVRFLALRAVSDPADVALPPEMRHWVDAQGQPRAAAVLAWLARHPHRLPMLMRLHRDTTRAARALAASLPALLTPTPKPKRSERG
ncbi:MAG: hypothetical protein WD534_09540 [Phycisphaeraceae bacterium]